MEIQYYKKSRWGLAPNDAPPLNASIRTFILAVCILLCVKSGDGGFYIRLCNVA
jgi:hypothetical protein